MTTLAAGILQTTTGIDPAANARMIGEGLAALGGEGAEMAFTPEMSGLLDRDRTRAMASATDEAGDPTLAAAREAAAKHGLWVHLGSLAVRDGADDRLANRSFLIDASGEIRARYDKMHLFDVDLAGGERYRESATYAPGGGAVVADTPWGKLGFSICYDIRFPRLYETLTEAGATIVAVPAAFTRPTGAAHWETLLRARAIEAGVFVIAAAQAGVHEDGRATHGHSLVVDPWGTVVADLGDAAARKVVTLDLGLVAETRARVPAIDHRRAVTLA